MRLFLVVFIALALWQSTEVNAMYLPHMKAKQAKVKCNKKCRTIRHKRKVVRPWHAKILRIAQCESRRRWHLNTGNGFYGGLQFTLGTWHSAGGSGYPHNHSRLEQKYRAVRWHDKIGTWVTTAGWPVCGYR